MTQRSLDVLVRNGSRRVVVHLLAEGDTGRTLVFCHPAPGAGGFDPQPEQTWARGVTLLGADRPGYGQSDAVAAPEWPSVGAAADDLAALLDRRGSGPVGVAGWSAGGRVALALAARRPDLVDRVVVFGTPAPHEQVPWIPEAQQQALVALRGQPPETVQAVLRTQLTGLLPTAGSAGAALGLLAASAADEPALAQPGALERLTGMIEAAFAQGPAGLAADIAAYCLQPWGFEPAAVEAKTLLLYGSGDPLAGPRHGTWWQKHLPNARLEVVPGGGHLLILARWDRALSHLAPGLKRGQGHTKIAPLGRAI